jgi:hypothetical protein
MEQAVLFVCFVYFVVNSDLPAPAGTQFRVFRGQSCRVVLVLFRRSRSPKTTTILAEVDLGNQAGAER